MRRVERHWQQTKISRADVTVRLLLTVFIFAGLAGLAGLTSSCANNDAQVSSIQTLQWTGGLQGGIYSQTQFSQKTLSLTEQGKEQGFGTFTSKIFSVSSLANWLTLRWQSLRPYGKPLPALKQSESMYIMGNVLMGENRLLLRMDEATAVAQDESGDARQAQWIQENGDPSLLIAQTGIYNQALQFSADDELNIDVNGIENFMQGDHSFEAWWNFNPAQSGSLLTLYDGQEVLLDYGLAESATGELLPVIRNASQQWTANDFSWKNQSWNHLVFVFRAEEQVVTVYLNGIEVMSANHETLSSVNVLNAMKILTGALAGQVDELALYRRALSSTEVLDRYLRGIGRVLIQVKTCIAQNAFCSAEDFIGPDGSASTYYSEAENSLLHLPFMALIAAQLGKSIQFKARLETLDPSHSPQLQSIEAGYFLSD